MRRVKETSKTVPEDSPKKRRRTEKIRGEILFYGDSLTYGMAHDDVYRYDMTWPRLLEKRLAGKGLRVVESALCSRTSCFDDEFNRWWMETAEPHYFNGLHHLGITLQSHTPSYLILLLGTNDLKHVVMKRSKAQSAEAIARNVMKLAVEAKRHRGVHGVSKDLQVIVVSPPEIVFNGESKDMGYTKLSQNVSKNFGKAFSVVCKEFGFPHISLSNLIDMNESFDGVHWTEKHNQIVAEHVWKFLQKVI